jgi:hypothetical protein
MSGLLHRSKLLHLASEATAFKLWYGSTKRSGYALGGNHDAQDEGSRSTNAGRIGQR